MSRSQVKILSIVALGMPVIRIRARREILGRRRTISAFAWSMRMR